MNLLQENKVISLKKKYPEIKLEDAILRTTHQLILRTELLPLCF